MHRPLALIAFLACCLVQPLQGQDSSTVNIGSGTIAQAWKADTGWLEGRIARVFPEPGVECEVFSIEDVGDVIPSTR